MEDFFVTLWQIIYDTAQVFLQSKVFFWIKIFLMIYTTVLIVDVILLTYLSDVRKRVREIRRGAGSTKVTKRSDTAKWKEIEDRLQAKDEKQYRAAILEADQFVYTSLEMQGYSGGNFAERISQIPAGSFDSIEVVRDAHALSKQIIFDDKLRITQEQTKNALDVYKSFLQDIDVL